MADTRGRPMYYVPTRAAAGGSDINHQVRGVTAYLIDHVRRHRAELDKRDARIRTLEAERQHLTLLVHAAARAGVALEEALERAPADNRP